MTSDIFEPWSRLIPIVVLGRVLEVPENNTLLRQLQYLCERVGTGRFCWNGECRSCEVRYLRQGDGIELSVLACRVKGWPGMTITRLAPDLRYALARALAEPPAAEGEQPKPSGASEPHTRSRGASARRERT